MGKLDGRIAIITGGSGGIGRAAAKRFVEEGAKVLLVDIEERALRDAVDAIGSKDVSSVGADVTSDDDTRRYVETAVERYGRIDILLANAGIEGNYKPIPEYPIEVFDRVIAVNVRGVWLGLKHVIPVMAKGGGGSIVITSSTAGIQGYASFSAYVTSKHAVIGMMRTAALECAPLKIRVNTVNPAPIETRMMRSIEEQIAPGHSGQAKEQFQSTLPLGRYGQPEEVADVMLFLASDQSRYCTGGVYMVDGGVSAT
ncbi:MAG TPA: SDR family oxidoreductase [Candidatus Binataceae bacterium]|nr:SDR family oxidoreductase [Candidatus Binataceae bacterium]